MTDKFVATSSPNHHQVLPTMVFYTLECSEQHHFPVTHHKSVWLTHAEQVFDNSLSRTEFCPSIFHSDWKPQGILTHLYLTHMPSSSGKNTDIYMLG